MLHSRNASQRELEFFHREYSVKHYTVVMFIPLERRNRSSDVNILRSHLKAHQNSSVAAPAGHIPELRSQFRHRVLIISMSVTGTAMSAENMQDVSFLKTLCTDSITDQILLQNA